MKNNPAPLDNEDKYLHQPDNLEFWEKGHWYPFWESVRTAKQYSEFYTTVPDAPDGMIARE